MILFLIQPYILHAEETLESLQKNPGLYLNCQDVPIFYQGNPLEGLMSFAVLLPASLRDLEAKKIQTLITKELGSVGHVIQAKIGDVSGFGFGNRLYLQIGSVRDWSGKELPLMRMTLSVETSVILQSSHQTSSPRVWSINAFIKTPYSEEEQSEAMQKLLQEFVKNYLFVNTGQKPTFYLY
ncbi:MAG: hypothetical protein FJZ58_00225 [Chlamydiae bacterium]|nr:hypothetical protein [Chlamydiota bacterium]